jgi:hypothetical protein
MAGKLGWKEQGADHPMLARDRQSMNQIKIERLGIKSENSSLVLIGKPRLSK